MTDEVANIVVEDLHRVRSPASGGRAGVARGAVRMRRPVVLVPLLLAACAAPAPEPPAETYARVPAEVANNDTNVYYFHHIGPNSLGTLAVTARPTAGPNAAPAGTIAGEGGRAKAEAAVAFYGSNELCDGAAFRLASEATSQYDPATNAWTVFGRCVGA
ncbi:MAG TPA: hypothetical protein VMM55_00740 [Thermohalobaculum sp.]|nr:hypothetical protein [Thermohalobaculum sp.]